MKAAATTRAIDVAEQLRRRILESDLPHGTFFMTEMELAEEYQVSRTVAREAAGRLKALGLLESRRRKGLLICKPDPLNLMAETFPSLISSDSDRRELCMLRYALEVGSIELAVRNATDEQLSRLKDIADQLEVACRARDHQAAIDADVAFHGVLLEMTDSQMIARMRQVLVDFIRGIPESRSDGESMERVIWEHRELYNAIRARDVERARSMIRIQSAAWFSTIQKDFKGPTQ